MAVATVTSVNVKQAVPFFGVTNMESSLRFYVDGLGFKMKNSWIPDRAQDHPDGRIRVFARTPPEGSAWDWSKCLLPVRRRAGSLSRVQIPWNSDAGTSVCRKPLVGRAGYRSRRLSHGVCEPHRCARRKRVRRVGLVCSERAGSLTSRIPRSTGLILMGILTQNGISKSRSLLG